MNTEEKIVQDLLDDLEHNRLTLPTLPEVALKIRDEIESDKVNAGRVASIVATDTALSAKLLQIANSPLYRAKNPIDNIQTAISRLGFTQIRNLVSSLVMKQMFQATSDLLDQRLRACWTHSVEVAAIASLLAQQNGKLQKDQAMLAGLVHDIGKLPILAHAEDIAELKHDAEKLDRVISLLHPTIGESILRKWDFPPALIACAREHENLNYTHAGAADYVDITIVANLQTYMGSEHPLTRQDWSGVSAFERLGLSSDINVVDIQENREALAEIEHILITA